MLHRAALHAPGKLLFFLKNPLFIGLQYIKQEDQSKTYFLQFHTETNWILTFRSFYTIETTWIFTSALKTCVIVKCS